MSTTYPPLKTEVIGTLRLAGPVVAAQLAQTSMTFVDTIMVGRLGSDALAGVALGNTVFFFVFIVSMGVVAAVGPMVAQAYGAGETDPIGRSVRQGLWLALALSVPVVLLLQNIEPVLLRLGQQPEVAARAQAYLAAISWGFLPAVGFMALRGLLEGTSRPFPVTVITFVGVGLNIVANYVLMYGRFGVPAMGLAGTGWASTIVFWILFFLLAVFVGRVAPYRDYGVFEKLGRPDPQYFREIFRIGWPIGVQYGMESGLFTVTALMMGSLGATVLAAHQIAIQSAAFTFMVPLGIGIAASVRVGQAAGRGQFAEVRQAGFVGIGLAALAMSGAAVLFWTAPRAIVALYLDLDASNAPVVSLAVTLLGVAAVFQVFDGVQVSAAGALRGLKDTRVPMVIGFVAYWAVGLSAGYLLGFRLGWGAVGLWWGLVIGLASAAILLTWRFGRRSGLGRADTYPARK